MRLADLKADLEKGLHDWFPNPVTDMLEPSGALSPVWRVARRVAELYEECPECRGTGTLTNSANSMEWGMVESHCRRCRGTGAVIGNVSGLQLLVGKHATNAAITFRELARFLFGEEP